MADLLRSFDIKLDSSSGLYVAGSSIRGQVLVVLNQSVRSADLQVALKGEAHTHWVNKVSENINDSCQPLIDRSLQLWLTAHGTGVDSPVPAGQYTVPFRLDIPSSLPSTIEGEFGYVHYACSAKLELLPNEGSGSKRKPAVTLSKNIFIFADVKLSDFESSNAECNVEEEFELVGCFGSQGKLTASLSVNGQVFVRGSTVLAKVEMRNRNWRRRNRVARFSLIQSVLFHSRTFFNSVPENRTTQKEIEMFKFDLPPRGQTSTNDAKVQLAANLPPTSKSAAMISISYFLKLDLGNQCELVLPIVIASRTGDAKGS